MKRVLLTILCAVMTLGLMACTNNSEAEIVLEADKAYICGGFLDSGAKIATRIEYSEWCKGSYTDPNQPETVKINVGETEYSGTYVDSERYYGTYETRHRYKSADNNFFEINDDGILTAYFFGIGNGTGKKKSQRYCKSVALDFISDIFGSDLKGYEEKISFDDEKYTFEYVKYINGIESKDKITVVVSNSGQIYNYNAGIFGKVAEETVPEFDLTEIRKTVTERLDELIQDSPKTYDRVEYKDYNYLITLIAENRYAVLCDVTLSCAEIMGEHEIRVSEKIQFVIPLE